VVEGEGGWIYNSLTFENFPRVNFRFGAFERALGEIKSICVVNLKYLGEK
jgi:hypothetical protein